ncbi:MAG: DUF4340 domain-containing protein [Gemmatimonadota bacterium]|jgi:hypothetical protein
MSESTLRRIILALVAFVVAWILITLTRGGGRTRDDGEMAQALRRLQQDTAEAFTITAAGEAPIEIAKSGGPWTVNGMPADSDAVNRLRSAVSGAAVGDLVSTSPRNHERLGVGSDSAWSLVVHAGTRTDTLLVGKTSQRTGYTYVRLPDHDQTWEVSGDLRGAAAHTIPDWRDKVMARVDTTALSRIDITRGDTTFAIVKNDAGWTLAADGAAADSMAVHGILTELSRFAATSIAPDTATFDGADHRRVIAIATSGDTLADLEFAGGEYIWRGRTTGDSTLYAVASYAIDRIAPKRGDVAKMTP